MTNIIRRFFSAQYFIKPSQKIGEIPKTNEIYQTAFQMAWPCAMESVLVGLIGSIDTLMVSTLGKEAISAVGITNQPKFILLAMIFSLNIGVTAIISRRKGQNDYEGANSCLKQCILISFILSFVMAILGFIFAKPLLVFAGAGPDYINDAIAYFRILMVSIVFTSLTLTINAAQRGAGNTKISMKTNIGANIFNLIFNYLLINGIWFFPMLGVKGAAIATVIGSIVGCIMSIRSLLYRSEFLEIKSKVSWKFDKKTIAALFSISGSAMVEQVFMRIGFFSYVKIVASLGTVAFSTHQICMNILNLSFSFGDGLSVASASLVGQNLGAKRPDMAIIYGKAGQRMAFIISSLLFFVFAFAGKFLILLFSREAEIISLGSIIMIIIACTTHIQTSQVVYNGCLRGAGDTKFVALTSFISIAIIRPFLTWLLCFPLNFGLIGAWVSLFFDQLLRFLLSRYRFSKGKWTKIEV